VRRYERLVEIKGIYNDLGEAGLANGAPDNAPLVSRGAFKHRYAEPKTCSDVELCITFRNA